MKQFFSKIKKSFPKIKSLLIDSLPLLLIYQGILFLFNPVLLNQILVFVLLFLFIIKTFLEKN